MAKYTAQQRRAYGEGFLAGKSRLGTYACCYKSESQSGISWFNGYMDGKAQPAFNVSAYISEGLGEMADFCPSDNT